MCYILILFSLKTSLLSGNLSWLECEKWGLLFSCADLCCSESQSLSLKPRQNLGLLLLLLFTICQKFLGECAPSQSVWFNKLHTTISTLEAECHISFFPPCLCSLLWIFRASGLALILVFFLFPIFFSFT